MKPARPDPTTSSRMARIRQRDTAIEAAVAIALRNQGFRCRKKAKELPGRPDFANRSRRWAVFVNGCFWHHHTACRKETIPKTNASFWRAKFRDNRRRDARAILRLRQRGFKVVLIWGCEIDRAEFRLGKVLEASRIDCRQAGDH